MTGGVFPERDSTEPARLERIPRVVKVDGVHAAGAERLREVHEDGAGVALVMERGGAEQNLVDVERFMQVELDARVVLKHLEAEGVLAADELLFRVDADVEMVEEQIVVGAMRPVLAAEDVGVRGSLRRGARRAQKNTEYALAQGPVEH